VAACEHQSNRLWNDHRSYTGERPTEFVNSKLSELGDDFLCGAIVASGPALNWITGNGIAPHRDRAAMQAHDVPLHELRARKADQARIVMANCLMWHMGVSGC
jgi:hypothetical protein